MGNTAQKQAFQAYTYADYLTWNGENERYEIIDGRLYDMSPAPATDHQIVVTNLSEILSPFFKNKGCRVFAAPFDVRLDPRMKPVKKERDEEIKTVVQPDVSVYCNKSRLDEKGGNGAPDIIVEVLSPHTRDKDLSTKLLLYMRNKVKEYWIADPENQTIRKFVLDDKGYYLFAGTFSKEEKLTSEQFEDLEVELKNVFDY